MPRWAATLMAFIAVAAVSCTSEVPTGPSGPVDLQVVLRPGQMIRVEGASISLRFRGVMGDSRCPADAICVWAGDALVRIEVVPDDGRSTTHDLHTISSQSVQVGDLSIALVTLAPYPFSSRPIAQEDYRATLRVTR